MVLGATGGKRGNQLLRLQHCKGMGHMQSCNVPFRQVANNIKVFAGCRWLFSKSYSCLSGSAKPACRCIFDEVSLVKSAFALLLTRVTEPRTVRFWRLEVIKCKER